MKRVNFYIDGFNLYFGIVESGYNNCKWLDIQSLANTLKTSYHIIGEIKYFTSRINNNSEKQKRQNIYLEAIETTNVKMIFGEFRSNWMQCKHCPNGWYDSKEKKTDVNIAVNIMKDAFEDKFDEAILISGDSDLVPPVAALRTLFPQKDIRLAFPPGRESAELKKAASGSFNIGVKKLEQCQFPEKIKNRWGNTIIKPTEWK